MRITLTIFLVALGLPAMADSPLRFNRDVRPVLSENCFACHGPDKKKRKAKMRLDVESELDLDELIARIESTDPDEVMPPPESEKSLSVEEKARIKQWIAEGAKWQGHWVFEKPVRSEVPRADRLGPIDAFVRTELKARGLKPSPSADRRTLLRRLSFDLTGMPPTAEEVDAFMADDSADAYGNAVDRLMASPRYGERMAIYWLDLVRYADSIGYHSDTTRDVYFFREYVIDAFNKNKPYNVFVAEQLAGDLMPEATQEQRIASGYNRLLQTTEEGGAQPKEYQAIYMADRVRNVSGAFMGGTLGCAQCHDHKFDPYTAKDFYSMAAFFADVKEKPVGKRDPGMLVSTGDHKAKIAAAEAQIARLQKQATMPTPELLAAQAEWEKGLSKDAPMSIGDWKLAGPFTGGDFKAVYEKAFGPEKGDGAKSVAKPEFKDGVVHALPGDANAAWYLGRTITVPADTALPVSLGSDDAIRVWLNGAEVLAKLVSRGPAPDQEKLSLALKKGVNRVVVKIVNSGGGAGFYFKAGESGLPQDVVGILAVPGGKRDDAQRKRLTDHFLATTHLLNQVRAELDAARKTKADLEKQLPRQLVSVSVKPREMRILPRGNWLDDSGEVVQPAIPAFLGGLNVEGRPTRLDLAKWMVSPENPMTSRTFVNRLWKLFFGAGIARNVDDLGSQGSWPTHPELLDWLAVEFVDSGWDVKKMVRNMVTSETYRQSSLASAESRKRDPLNEWLSRQARFRIDAEMVRDNALSIGGLLVEKMGGSSVKPYQPAGYWRHLNFPARKWAADKGENQYRRGLYTHWQRSFLHPSLLAFDAPSREECTAERPRSNTPLQALVLLNDPTYVEAAEAFGKNIAASGGDDGARIDWAFRKALQRRPSDAERAVVLEVLAAEPDAAAGWKAIARVLLNLHETITRN